MVRAGCCPHSGTCCRSYTRALRDADRSTDLGASGRADHGTEPDAALDVDRRTDSSAGGGADSRAKLTAYCGAHFGPDADAGRRGNPGSCPERVDQRHVDHGLLGLLQAQLLLAEQGQRQPAHSRLRRQHGGTAVRRDREVGL